MQGPKGLGSADGEYEPRGFPQTESFSNLWLQICLMQNGLFSLALGAIELILVVTKLQNFEIDTFRKVLTPLVFVVWAIAEVFRLWFGYAGNVQEKVPQLSAFILVTVFPQVPCLVYLTFAQAILLPADLLFGCLQLAFCGIELYLCYGAVRVLVARQSANFFRLLQDDQDQVIAEHEQATQAATLMASPRNRQHHNKTTSSSSAAINPAKSIGTDDSEETQRLLRTSSNYSSS